jgi:predicted PurR-regulated permease PerM
VAKTGALAVAVVAGLERRRRAAAAAYRAKEAAAHPSGSEHIPAPRTEAEPAPPADRPAVAADSVPWGLRVAAEAAWRLLLLGIVLYIVLRVVDTLRLVAYAVLAALLISALLQPTVSWLRRHGVPRALAAAGTFLTGVAGIGLVGWFVFWQVSTNVDSVSKQAQGGVNQVRLWLVQGPLHLTQQQIDHFATEISTAIGTNSQQITSAGFAGVSIAVEVLTGVVLAAFTTYFLLYDGAKIWNWVLRGLPQNSRHAMAGAGPKAWTTLTAYVRGTVFVAFIDALCIGIGIQLLGVPLAMPLAVIIFLGAFIPLVGAMITGTLAVLIAMFTAGPSTALAVLVLLVAVMQIEGHLLQPLILGRAVQVHPLGVVLGVAAGSIIGGIGGAVVAVPLIAVTNSVVSHLRRAK